MGTSNAAASIVPTQESVSRLIHRTPPPCFSDDIIAMNKKTRGVGARGRGRGRGAGGGGARPVAQRRPWNRQKLVSDLYSSFTASRRY